MQEARPPTCFADIPPGPLCRIAQFLSVIGHIYWTQVCKKVRAATYQNRLAWGADYEMSRTAVDDLHTNVVLHLHPAVVWAMGCRDLQNLNVHLFVNDLTNPWMRQFGAQLVHLTVALPWNIPRTVQLPQLRSLVIQCTTDFGNAVAAVKISMPNLEHIELSVTDRSGGRLVFPETIQTANIRVFTMNNEDGDDEYELPSMPGVTKLVLRVDNADDNTHGCFITNDAFPALTDLDFKGDLANSPMFLCTDIVTEKLVNLHLSTDCPFSQLVDGECSWDALRVLVTDSIPPTDSKMPSLEMALINTLVKTPDRLLGWRDGLDIKYQESDQLPDIKPDVPTLFIRRLACDACFGGDPVHGCSCVRCTTCDETYPACNCDV
jgi:hypothetical protein